MYKTLIQLVLLLVLILIIFFIYNKYFYTEDKIDEVKNTNSLRKESVENKKNKFPSAFHMINLIIILKLFIP